MHRLLSLLAAMLLIPAIAAAATDDDDKAACALKFYQTKSMSCVDNYIDAVKSVPQNRINGNFLGFMALVFANYPDEKQHILSEKTISPSVKGMFLEALWLAGLVDDAKAYAQTTGMSSAFSTIQSHHVPTIKQIQPPYSDIAQNDVLLGAFFATGDTSYIHTILVNCTQADDGSIVTALRIAMMQGRFMGKTKLQDHIRTISVAACTKYDCKKNIRPFLHVMVMSSGFWALQSLAQKDALVKKTFNDFFNNDARLRQLLVVEYNGFANYLSNLIVLVKTPNNAQAQSYVTAYDNLASMKDLQAIMLPAAAPAKR